MDINYELYKVFYYVASLLSSLLTCCFPLFKTLKLCYNSVVYL